MKNSIYMFLITFIVCCFVMTTGFVNHANASNNNIQLGFEPLDTVLDEDKPIVYMTHNGSKHIYAVNYETGTVKSLSLPYIAERLAIYKGKLYVTQLKFKHSSYNDGPYNGSVAIVDTKDFSFQEMLSVDADPYDLVVDKDGYLYMTPGSGQWSNIKVYSLSDKKEVENIYKNTSIYEKHTITYNPTLSKIYTMSTTLSPRDISVFDVSKGSVTNSYDSPYHGDYILNREAKISPDDTRIYSASSVFTLDKEQIKDLYIKNTFDEIYNDFEFSLKDNVIFAASKNGGIHVSSYDKSEFLYTLNRDITANQLLFKDGLLAIYSDSDGNYYLRYLEEYGPGSFAVDQQAYTTYDEHNKLISKDIVNKAQDIPTYSEFKLQFNHNMTLKDLNQITLQGPNGKVNLRAVVDKDLLTITPEYLLDDTTYTLTIGKDALVDYTGKSLGKDHTIQFTTAVSPVAELSMSMDSEKAPLAYTFTANAAGGREPMYQFEVYEGNSTQGKVLQKYSSSPNLVWRPSHQGTYTIKALAKSKKSTASVDKETSMKVSVVDEELPTAIIMPSTNELTNGNVTITVQAQDNLGIRAIRLPKDDIVYQDKAVYTATANGTYTFEVEDVLGNITTKSITISNIDKVKPLIELSPNTTAPTNKYVRIVANTGDNEGIKQIQLPDGTTFKGTSALFVATKSGIYQFTVEDKAGNKTTKSIAINNIFIGKPSIPTVNAIWDSHTVIKGKATPNTTVYAKKGKTVISSAKVSSKGNYSIKITKQKAGTSIEVYVKDPYKNVSKSKIVKVLDKTAPATPKINQIMTYTKTLTGKAEVGATIYVYSGNKYIKKGTVNSKGQIKISIAKQKKGTTLTIFAKDKAGNKSKSCIIKVK